MGVVVGSRAVPTSTGNFSVTGLPFQPVAVMFWNQVGQLAPVSMMFGCATGSSEQWVMWTGWDSETTTYTRRQREGRTDRCVLQYHAPYTTIAWAASFVSMNSDGFTLHLDTWNVGGTGEGNNLYYMALGGNHITDAYAGTVFTGGSTGTTAVTAPGFRPTAAIFAQNVTTFGSAKTTYSVWGVGLTDGTSQFSSCDLVVPAGAAVDMRHIYRTDAVACVWDGGTRGVIKLDSIDANGFTLNTTEVYTGATQAYLAIKADGAVAGHDVQPNSNGGQNYSTPGLIPEGVFFCWPGADSPSTSGTSAAPLRPGIGGGTISEQRLVSGISRSTAPAGVWTSDGFQVPTEPLGFWGVGDGIGGGTTDSQASASLTSMNAGSFDMTWATVLDTNDRVFGWLALPGELIVHWIPQSFRRW